jgi:hypothetical protein
MRTLTQRKTIGLYSAYPPGEWSWGISGSKHQHIPGKTEFPSGATSKKSCTLCTFGAIGATYTTPNKKSKIIGNLHTNCVLRKRASRALRPPLPWSWVQSSSTPRSIFLDPLIGERGGERGGEREGGRAGERGFRGRYPSRSEENCTGVIKYSRAEHVSWLYMNMYSMQGPHTPVFRDPC